VNSLCSCRDVFGEVLRLQLKKGAVEAKEQAENKVCPQIRHLRNVVLPDGRPGGRLLIVSE
jgi:hypothetical protein